MIIGDFTAQIGDPSGRNSTRPPLSHEEVLENAKTFTDQAFLVIDKEKTEVVYNGEWFSKMSFKEIISLNSRVTLQQMLQREDFRKRIDESQEVRLHEIQYPVMQGWDSVEVRADVEIGGSDQLFNILVGRDMQKAEGQAQQVVMTLPLLEGLDGVRKMSKSYDNYIGLTEAPDEMYGKLMSISDELMPRYYELVLMEEMPADGHPMDLKKALAAKVVTLYHDESSAQSAAENWLARFSSKDLDSAELPEFTPSGERSDLLGLCIEAYASLGDQRSSSDVRRLIGQGSVQINGEKASDIKLEPDWSNGDVLKLDKKRSVRVLI